MGLTIPSARLGASVSLTHTRVSEPDRASAWAATRALTPRDVVRAASQDVSGEILNDYSRDWSVNALPPQTTWAMYLSADSRTFNYLCFDLDSSRGNAPYDAGRLSLWLDELNVSHLVCESGPTGGRHVWIGLSASVDGKAVRDLALLATQLLPSLDPTPLLNPATGCVRPPGAPHRLGGVSVALGPLAPLTAQPVPPESVSDLAAFLVDAGAELPTAELASLHGMAVDQDGHPYMAGPKRALSPRVAALVDESPATDASYTLASVLAGCAHSRWRYADVLELIDSPAFEHVRTMRTKRGQERTARSATGRVRTLTNAWNNAVRYVASHPLNGAGDDADYLARSNRAVAAVERAQERANAMPGLWGADRASSAARRHTGTHSTRAVLDALCLYITQSAQLTVEADVRRLSADTGYGRTTVHTALQRLAQPTSDSPESAWIVRVGEPEGPHGQRYRLSEKFSTEDHPHDRTQVPARPAGHAPTPTHAYWLTHLHNRLRPLRHDTFAAPHSLGRTTGVIYAALHPDAITTVDELRTTTGLDADRIRKALDRLSFHRLAHRGPAGWIRADHDSLDQAADVLDVAGYLERRRAAYGNERALWEWWSAELAWMRKPNKKRRGRRAATGVALFAQNDRPDYARYPRGPDGRGDHKQALHLVRAGILSPAAALDAA